ncbi:metal-dependent hydrolase, partial [Psychrobacter sp. T6-1]
MTPLKYIAHYPEHIQTQASELISSGRLGAYIEQRYPDTHQIQSDKALYQYVNDIKTEYMRKSGTLS